VVKSSRGAKIEQEDTEGTESQSAMPLCSLLPLFSPDSISQVAHTILHFNSSRIAAMRTSSTSGAVRETGPVS
jgi:hypothetical protein